VDRRVIEQKLETLRYCVNRVADRCPENAGALARDPDSQDIIALNLSRAVQQCIDIGAHLITSLDLPTPGTMGETFDRLAEGKVIDGALANRLNKAVGFSNIAMHNYDRIKWDIVHAVCSRHLDDFRAFAREVTATL
jgi:uncharacterized protein YutE (UPF0331/DUF86 family)